MLETFAQHLDLSTVELENLLSLSLTDFLNLPQVNQLLESLDTPNVVGTYLLPKTVISPERILHPFEQRKSRNACPKVSNILLPIDQRCARYYIAAFSSTGD